MVLSRIFRQGTRTFFVALLFAAVFAFAFTYVPEVMAQDVAGETVAEAAGLQSTPLPVIIGRIISVILGLMGVVLLGYIIYGGFLWMTAGGKPEQVAKAKKVIINAVIGLIIMLSSFAITSFVVSALTGGQGIFGGGGAGPGFGTGGPSVESQSGSFGRGAIRDHFPNRGATDVPRNTKIYVTFKEAMAISSFAAGYDMAGTPLDVSDDIPTTALNAENIQIYVTEDGEESALNGEQVSVSFTSNLKTFVFNPPILGSNSEDVQYTVALSDNIQNADGATVINNGGYEWHFEVGTELDLTPPSVKSVTPVDGGTYDRNITVQINFDEGVDPTSATGLYDPATLGADFDNIQVKAADDSIIPGRFEISNEYKTVTFTTLETCGTNSCGEDMFCLPSAQAVSVDVIAATPGDTPPQVDIFPYNGVTDITGNALDGNGDGTAGDSYTWGFNTTSDINLTAPAIESIVPDILAEDVDLDQPIMVTFNTVMSGSTLGAETIEILPNPDHEMWYGFSREELTESGDVVSSSEDVPDRTQITVRHGVFLETTPEQTYRYSVNISDGVRSEYQNCFNPGQGPGAGGGTCGTSASAPHCCNGVPSSTACVFF